MRMTQEQFDMTEEIYQELVDNYGVDIDGIIDISYNYIYDQLRQYYKVFNSDLCSKTHMKKIEKVRKALYTVLSETFDHNDIESFESLDTKFKSIYGE